MKILLAAVGALGLIGSVAVLQAQPAPAGSASAAMRGAGYLARERLPDSLTLLPPPPGEGSRLSRIDARGEAAALALRGGARWDMARVDADLGAQATSAFSCAAGREIGPKDTPLTDRLLRRTMIDFAGATSAAKDHYKRPRPFMTNKQPICTPDIEAGLRGNGSYPSGHAALGYGWGLVLARLVPQHASALLLRGSAFADSRRVCNVHWASDVAAGKQVAREVMPRLLADPAFRADLSAARAELANRGARPAPATCAAERRAVALVPRG